MTSPMDRKKDQSRATWQLPMGVSRGTWDYVTEPAIAKEYDRFHAGHPLLELDRKLIAEHLGPSATKADRKSLSISDVAQVATCSHSRNRVGASSVSI
jgi:hypothetical protein